jgi:hypothetical protein
MLVSARIAAASHFAIMRFPFFVVIAARVN